MRTRVARAALAFALCAGCSRGGQETAAPVVLTSQAGQGSSKRVVPATTRSPDAAKLFERGRLLIESGRREDGLAELGQALKADPSFAMALAYQGYYGAPDGGLQTLQRAASIATDLDEPEQLYIDYMLSLRGGDRAAARAHLTALERSVPDEWRVEVALGELAEADGNWPQAEDKFGRALALNSSSGEAMRGLGEAQMRQGKYDAAQETLRLYARTFSADVTPLMLLGELNLRAGHPRDADAEYLQAAKLLKPATPAWLGAARARAMAGDVAGARQAFDAADAAAQATTDAQVVPVHRFWFEAGQGDTRGALAAASRLESLAAAARDEAGLAAADVYRCIAELEAGRVKPAREALQASAGHLGKARPSARLAEVQALGGLEWVRVGIEEKKPADVDHGINQLDLAVAGSATPGNLGLRTLARALVSWSRKDREIALQQLLECAHQHPLCLVETYQAREMMGDAAGAASMSAEQKAALGTEPIYLYTVARMSPHTGK